jgi:hypothetical protein
MLCGLIPQAAFSASISSPTSTSSEGSSGCTGSVTVLSGVSSTGRVGSEIFLFNVLRAICASEQYYLKDIYRVAMNIRFLSKLSRIYSFARKFCLVNRPWMGQLTSSN